MSKPLLLAIQYWAGDMEAAYGLAELLSEVTLQANEGRKSPEADILFVARYDAEIDLTRVRKIGRAFNQTWTWRCDRKGEAWPDGCNQMAYGTYGYFVERNRGNRWDYEGLWLMESDSIPMVPDVIARVAQEWRECVRKGQHVLGYWVCDDNGPDHVNGNMVIHRDFIQFCPQFGSLKTDAGWDVVHKKELLHHSMPSRLIFSDYHCRVQDCFDLFAPRPWHYKHPYEDEKWANPAWLHGPKDTVRAQACARQHLLGAGVEQQGQVAAGLPYDPMIPVMMP